MKDKNFPLRTVIIDQLIETKDPKTGLLELAGIFVFDPLDGKTFSIKKEKIDPDVWAQIQRGEIGDTSLITIKTIKLQ